MTKTNSNRVKDNIPGLGVEDLLNQIRLRASTKQVLYIEGAPGMGKTQLVYQGGAEMGFTVMDYLVSECLPEDFGGIVTADLAKRQAVRLMPDIVARITEAREQYGKPVLAFFDELNNGTQSVFSACMKLLHEGKAGGYAVPEDTVFFAAGNNPNTSSVANELPAPLFNRMSCVVYAGPTQEEMETHMMSKRWHPAVMHFLHQNPQFIKASADFHAGGPQPTPRSWDATSKMLLALDAHKEAGRNIPPRVRMHAIESDVGSAAANMIAATLRFGDDLVPWAAVKKGPATAKTPKDFVPAYMQVMTVLTGLSGDIADIEVGAKATPAQRVRCDESIRELARCAIDYARRLPAEVMGVFVHTAARNATLRTPLALHWSIEELRAVQHITSAGRTLDLGGAK